VRTPGNIAAELHTMAAIRRIKRPNILVDILRRFGGAPVRGHLSGRCRGVVLIDPMRLREVAATQSSQASQIDRGKKLSGTRFRLRALDWPGSL